MKVSEKASAEARRDRDYKSPDADAAAALVDDDVTWVDDRTKAEPDEPATSRPPRGADPAGNGKPGRPRISPRRVILPVIALLVAGGAGWYGYDWFTVGRFMVSTDDAYVAGDITTIAPKVSGYVARVDVAANQRVRAGDPLVTLDDGDYRIAADVAGAQIATQKLTLARIDAQITGAEAALDQARAQSVALQAAAHNADLARSRAAQLRKSDFAPQSALDTANAAFDQANANLSGAEAGIKAAEANIAVLKAQRAEAASAIRSLELNRDKAERDLGFTVLRAPYDGVVGNLAVQDGDLVAPGQRLAALVPVDRLYVEANFKETQIRDLVPGEKVLIHVDAYGSEPIEGTVASLSPASGSVFSLLPAENATGNFTKVVQRVPVRIALPADALASGRLKAGLSVVVDVDSRTAPQGAAR
ncbi:MAG TPA: HlyD family secretion protein [Devosiaceae bacterium]